MISPKQPESSKNSTSYLSKMSNEEIIRAYLNALFSEDHGPFGPKRRVYQAEMLERGIRASELKLYENLRATKNRAVHSLH